MFGHNLRLPFSIISVNNEWIGTLEVCYLEEKPELDEGPFLKEAKNLINAVAENIAKIIEREEAEAEIRKHQDHIEALIRKAAKKGDPHKINNESPLTAILFISFFEKKFKPIGACSGYKIAGLFLPGHFIPAPFFNEFTSLPCI